jgi:hypothetical protein
MPNELADTAVAALIAIHSLDRDPREALAACIHKSLDRTQA